MAEETAKRAPALPASVYEKLVDAFLLYICLYLSELLIGNGLIGASLCLCGQVLMVFMRLYSKTNSILLPYHTQAGGLLILVASILLTIGLFFVYPALTTHENIGLLVACVCTQLVQHTATDLLAQRLRMRRLLKAPILLLIHASAMLAMLLILVEPLTAEALANLTTMLIATSAAALARQCLLGPKRRRPPAVNPDRLYSISSYRIFNRMVSSSMVALNLAMLTYICTMTGGIKDITARFWDLIVWLMLVGAMTALIVQFLRRRGLTQYDKPSVFAAGAAMLALAIISTYQNWFSGWGMLVSYFFWGGGLASLLSIIISLGADMKDVLELDMPPEELAGYWENTQAVVEWNLTFSSFLVVLMLTVVALLSEGRLEALEDIPFVRFVFNSMSVWPVVFIFIALLNALAQPLNKDYAKKLARYRAQQRLGNVNPALRTRLQMQLVHKTRSILPSILRMIVRPFLPCRVIGKERVHTQNGPVVFVCNHLEIYGPLVTNLWLPFYFRTWIINQMLDKEIVVQHIQGGVDVVLHWIPARMRRRISYLVAPLVRKILLSLDPIPVYRGTMREVIKTIQLTVDAMEYEDNILLFPENPGEEQYQQVGVSQFYSGFATIGAEYYKRTGNCTTFYPMYVNKAKRTLTIGEGILYDGQNNKSAEKTRIVTALHDWMNAQADAP